MTLEHPHVQPYLMPRMRKYIESNKKKYAYSGPSNLISLCPRQLWYEKNFIGDIYYKLESIINFAIGFPTEDFIERLLKESKIKIITSQVVITADDFGFTSPRRRGDFVIESETKGAVILLEIKKMSGYRFSNFKQHGLIAEEAAHYQILDYLHNWKGAVEQGAKLPKMQHGDLVGVQMDPVKVMDTRVLYVEKDYEKLSEKKSLLDPVIQGISRAAPSKAFKRGDFHCKSCPFKNICWSPLSEDVQETFSNEDAKVFSKIAETWEEAKFEINKHEKTIELAEQLIDEFLDKFKVAEILFQDDERLLTVKTSSYEREDIKLPEFLEDHPTIARNYTKKTRINKRSIKVKRK